MGLNRGRRARARFDHVRIQGPLHQESRAAMLPSHLLEDADELLADPPALLLRIRHIGQTVEEPVRGLDVNERDAEVSCERVLDLVWLALAQEARVHEDA